MPRRKIEGPKKAPHVYTLTVIACVPKDADAFVVDLIK